MVFPSRRVLVDELDRYDRLLEVGIGDRRGVARALADRGCDVVAVDVAVDGGIEYGPTDADGSLLVRRGDVVAIASLDGPLTALDGPQSADPSDPVDRGPAPTGVDDFDAVYALNLPAELQRPAVSLADALDADCLFTTLGFEEPIVPAERRSVRGTTVHVARESHRET
ncbi:uncharacterized UPF0146 family protein [Halorubrum alkaliphilum]|uniref:Uncharacterized UPF0146 family protein n=1 Tax=Halorubrum alkaliphilum TaxID=261290 RepID=A0A8T4GIX7_9EURY|nr:UPF0146 family protein [Halorubrum alkaliphilum]MBP1922965.1 uncharacterized UPF0146 family protein [Halorubrum alkaliphilum]